MARITPAHLRQVLRARACLSLTEARVRMANLRTDDAGIASATSARDSAFSAVDSVWSAVAEYYGFPSADVDVANDGTLYIRATGDPWQSGGDT